MAAVLILNCTRPSRALWKRAQVLDVGVTRLLVQRLVRVFSHLCENADAVTGSAGAAFHASHARLAILHRRCRACRAPPGYALFVVWLFCLAHVSGALGVCCYLFFCFLTLPACFLFTMSYF